MQTDAASLFSARAHVHGPSGRRPCPCCSCCCRKRRRQRPLGSAQCCASCGTRQRNAWNAWAKLGLLESPNIGAVQRACQHLMVIAAKRFSMLACKNINIFNLCYILTDSYRARYRIVVYTHRTHLSVCNIVERREIFCVFNPVAGQVAGAATSSKRRLSQIHRPLHSYRPEE